MNEEFIRLANKFYLSTEHPLSVASRYEEGSDEWVVALFHDLLEDTDIDRAYFKEFLQKHEKEHCYPSIVMITRRSDETYFSYIHRLEGIAKEVKKTDLKQNLSRTATLSPSLKKRYLKALSILEGELEASVQPVATNL